MILSQDEIRTYHFPGDERMRYVLSPGRGLINKCYLSCRQLLCLLSQQTFVIHKILDNHVYPDKGQLYTF